MLNKKGQQRLFCLRKVARFNVDRSLMKMFYSSYIHSVISFSIVCWFGNLSIKDKNTLGKIVKTASKIIGTQMESLESFFNRQLVRKARIITNDEDHPLFPEYTSLPSGLRFVAPRATKNRYRLSFVPASIRALNSANGR